MSPVVIAGDDGGVSVGRHVRSLSGKPFWLLAQASLPDGRTVHVDLTREDRDKLVKALQDLG